MSLKKKKRFKIYKKKKKFEENNEIRALFRFFFLNAIRVLIEGEKIIVISHKWYGKNNKTLNSLCNNYFTS